MLASGHPIIKHHATVTNASATKQLLRDKFESWRFAPLVTAPTTIIAAEHDEMIPRASTERLLSRFKNGHTAFKAVPGTGHNTISNSPEYLELLNKRADCNTYARPDIIRIWQSSR